MDHFAKPTDELALALEQGRLQRNFQGYSTHADCDLIGIGVSSIGKVGVSYIQNQKDLPEYYASIDRGELPVMRGLLLKQDDLLRRNLIQTLMCQFSLLFAPFEEQFDIQFKGYDAEAGINYVIYQTAEQTVINFLKKQFERKLKLEKTLIPKENHKAFEYNLKKGELQLAEFMEEPVIKWEDVVNKNFKNIKRKILKKDDCIYFTCLNFKNAIKILKRDFGINYR